MTTLTRLPVALLSLAALVSCSQEHPAGSMRVVAVMRNAVTAADVTSASITILGPGSTPIITGSLTRQSGAWEGVFVLPVGTYDVAATASGGGATLFTGTAVGVTVMNGQKSVLAMVLQDANPGTGFSDAAAAITSISASTDLVYQGGSVNLNATVVDPNGDNIHYSWGQAPANEGTFDTTSGTVTGTATPQNIAVNWAAPAVVTDNQVVLTLQIDDGKGSPSSLSVTIKLSSSSGTGTGSVTVRLNDPPIFDSIAVGPNQAAAGQTVHLGAHANDANGDIIAYSWTADPGCPGNFAPANGVGSDVTFTPIGVPETGNCAFTVTADDGHMGVATGTTNLIVTQGGGPQASFGPTITGTSQQAGVILDGTPIALSADAVSNGGGNLTFDWAVTSGGFVPTTGTNHTSIVWTPGLCSGIAEQATLTVTDQNHISAVAVFPLVNCANSCQMVKQYLPAATNGYYEIDADGPGGAAPANTFCDDMGSGGGDFHPTVNTTLPGGVNRFQSVHIPAGVVVTIDPARNNGVLEIRATGDVLIEGTIDVSGSKGGDGPNYPAAAELWVGAGGGRGANPNGPGANAPSSPVIAFGELNTAYDCGPLLAQVGPGLGGGTQNAGGDGIGYYYCGVGGAGGLFGGGMGGTGGAGGGGGQAGGGGGAFSPPYNGGAGGGPFGGAGGAGPGHGGVATVAGYAGQDGVAGSGFSSGGGGSIGDAAANDLAILNTFGPGSAGGGGGGVGGAGGGGQGGGLRIVSPTKIGIAATGALLANGGDGGRQVTQGYYFNGTANLTTGGSGGAGSGGAIDVSAPKVVLLGNVSAVGGHGGRNDTLFAGGAGYGGDGGLGRIRFATEDLDTAGPCCTPQTGPSVYPPLPSAFDGTANGPGLAFVSARQPYELSVNANTPGISAGAYHLAAGGMYHYERLTIEPGYTLVIDPPTDCNDPAQTQMTVITVSGDVANWGVIQATGNTCGAGTYPTDPDRVALGVPASYTIDPGGSGGSGGNGGYLLLDVGTPRCIYGGSGPSGGFGGQGGGRSLADPWFGGNNFGCADIGGGGGGAGPGRAGLALFLKAGGRVAGTGLIDAGGESGGGGAGGAGGNYCAHVPSPSPGGNGFGGAGGGGGGGGGPGGYVRILAHGGVERAGVRVNVAGGSGGPGGPGGPGGGHSPCYGGYYLTGDTGAAGASGPTGFFDVFYY